MIDDEYSRNSEKRGREEDAERAAKRAREADDDYDEADEEVPPPEVKAPPPKTARPPAEAPAEMSFCLRWDKEHDIPETKFYHLEKPYLRTSSQISILHLKKYIIQKYQLKCGTAPLRFRCKGKLLGDDLKVADVFETVWLDPSRDLELHFCTTVAP